VPFGAYFGIKDTQKKIQIHRYPLLESEHRKHKSPTSDAIDVSGSVSIFLLIPELLINSLIIKINTSITSSER